MFLQLLLDVLQDATTTSSSSGVDSSSGSSSSSHMDSSSSSSGVGSSSSSRVDSSSSTGRATPATAPSAAAAALTSYGTTLPLLGALVTASKVTAAEVKWTLGDLGVMLKQLLLLSKLTFEVMGQLLGSMGDTAEEEEAGRDGEQQQHGGMNEVSPGGHEAAAQGFRRPEGKMERIVEGLCGGSSTPAVEAAASATSEALGAALSAAVIAASESTCRISGPTAAGSPAAGERRSALAEAVAAAGGAAAAAVLHNDPSLSSVPEAAKARTIAGIRRRCGKGVSALLTATLNCTTNDDSATAAAVTLWAEASMTGDVMAIVYAVATAEQEAVAAGDISTAAMEKEKLCSSPKQQQQQQEEEDSSAVGQRVCSRTQQLRAGCREQQVEGLLWAGCLSFSVVLDSLLRLTHAAALRAQEKADVAPPKSSRGSDCALIAAVKAATAAAALSNRKDSKECQDSGAGTAGSAAAATLSVPSRFINASQDAGSAANGEQQSYDGAEEKRICSVGTSTVGLALGGSAGSTLGKPTAVAAGCPSFSAGAAAAGCPSVAAAACEYRQSTLAALQEVPEMVMGVLERVGMAPLSSVLSGTDDGRVFDCILDQQGQSFLLKAACFDAIVRRLNKEGGWWHDGSGLRQLGAEATRALFGVVVERPASEQLWEGTVMSEVQELMVGFHEAGMARRNRNMDVQMAADCNAFEDL